MFRIFENRQHDHHSKRNFSIIYIVLREVLKCFKFRKGDFDNADKKLLYYEQLYDPHPRAYDAIIRQKVYLNNDLKSSLFYWSQMCSKCKPSILSYASIISACSKANNLRKAEELYRDCIAEFGYNNVVADYKLSAAMMVVYGKLGNPMKMTALYESCIKSYAFLDSKAKSLMVTALATGYCYLGKWEMVLNIWKSNYKHLSRGPKNFYQPQIRLLQSNGSSQFDLPDSKEPFESLLELRSIHVFGVTPVLLCIVLDSLGNAKKISQLNEIWTLVNEANFPLSLNNFTSYIEALCKFGDWDRALLVALKISVKHGFRIDEKTARNLLQGVPPLRRQYCYQQLIREYPYLAKYPKLIPSVSLKPTDRDN